jgi:predicted ferric reductase
MNLQQIGFISAYIGAFLIFLEIILSINTNIKYIKIHKILGKYGLLLLLIHPIVETIRFGGEISWLFLINTKNEYESFISSGRLAFILFLVIYISSVILRSKLKYQPWLYIHYLSYPLAFFVFRHSYVGNFNQDNLIVKALWTTLFFGFIVLIIWRLIRGSAILKKAYEISDLNRVVGNMLIIKLKPKDNQLYLKPKSGQYLYLQLRPFGQAHPFSITEFDRQTHEITLLIRQGGSFTKLLSAINVNSTVFLSDTQGDYLQNFNETQNNLFVAGGVGLASFVDFLKSSPESSKKVTLIHCVNKEDELVFKEDLDSILGDRYLKFITDKQELLSKENIAQLQSKYKFEKFYVCAGPALTKATKSFLFALNIKSNQIFTEEFSL